MPPMTLDLWKQDMSDDDLRENGWGLAEDGKWRHAKFGSHGFTRWDVLLFLWYALEESSP